jgi:hypothetical protein
MQKLVEQLKIKLLHEECTKERMIQGLYRMLGKFKEFHSSITFKLQETVHRIKPKVSFLTNRHSTPYWFSFE